MVDGFLYLVETVKVYKNKNTKAENRIKKKTKKNIKCQPENIIILYFSISCKINLKYKIYIYIFILSIVLIFLNHIL